MVKRGEKFPDEKEIHGRGSPGVVDDNELLERRLPPGPHEFRSGAVPRQAFTLRELQWTEDEGGASVVRIQYAQGGNTGRRGERSTIAAKARDIRSLADTAGNRLWSIIDRPTPDNPAHAEIQREPRGMKPRRSERDLFLEAWRGADALLENLRAKDQQGEPKLKLVRGIGIEIHWCSGDDGELTRVIQVESVFEAVRAYVAAGILQEQDAPEEVRRLRRGLEPQSNSANHRNSCWIDSSCS